MTLEQQILNGREGEAEIRAAFRNSKNGQILIRNAKKAEPVEANDPWWYQKGELQPGDEAIPSR